jgi:hypothetical protein
MSLRIVADETPSWCRSTKVSRKYRPSVRKLHDRSAMPLQKIASPIQAARPASRILVARTACEMTNAVSKPTAVASPKTMRLPRSDLTASGRLWRWAAVRTPPRPPPKRPTGRAQSLSDAAHDDATRGPPRLARTPHPKLSTRPSAIGPAAPTCRTCAPRHDARSGSSCGSWSSRSSAAPRSRAAPASPRIMHRDPHSGHGCKSD